MTEEQENQVIETIEETGSTSTIIRNSENVPIYCKVVGVSKDNPDRTNRQSLIRSYVERGTSAYLERDLLNLTDKHAVAVYVDTPLGRQQVGFLPNPIAREISNDLDLNHPWYAVVFKITGGTPDKPTIGLVLLLSQDEIKVTVNKEETKEPEKPETNSARTILIVLAIVVVIVMFISFFK